MNRCIYCDDNISIWGEADWGWDNRITYENLYIMENKTGKLIMQLIGDTTFPEDSDGFIYISSNKSVPQDIQAAFNLYDKDGNIEHIMPKED